MIPPKGETNGHLHLIANLPTTPTHMMVTHFESIHCDKIVACLLAFASVVNPSMKPAALPHVSWWANHLKRLVHQDTCGIFARILLGSTLASSRDLVEIPYERVPVTTGGTAHSALQACQFTRDRWKKSGEERFFQASKHQIPCFRSNSHPSVQNRFTLQLIYHLPFHSMHVTLPA
jgi:hypothetical protein